MDFPNFKKETKYIKEGYQYVVGIDEVGVSPLAGPVVAAACLLDPRSVGTYRSKKKWYYRVRDSKTTNEKERPVLLKKILEHSLAYGVGEVWPEDIDALNIHHATLLAMKLAAEQLIQKIAVPGMPSKILLCIDGRFNIPAPSCGMVVDQESIVAGDSLILSISAASIIAKVHRDTIMKNLDAQFPAYGFSRHKGYNTKEHQKAVKKLGITDIHRKSFFKKGWLKDAGGIK